MKTCQRSPLFTLRHVLSNNSLRCSLPTHLHFCYTDLLCWSAVLTFKACYMEITRSCKIHSLNWDTIPDLESRLTRHDVALRRVSVKFSYYPDTVEYDSFQEAANYVKGKYTPDNYSIWAFGRLHDTEFQHTISRGRNIHGQEYLYVTVSCSDALSILNSVMLFFGLKPDEPSTLPPSPPRTAFIAHRFDRVGQECADKLARFLQLLDFQVVTGRAYSPRSIAEKIRAKIEDQAIVFIILTPGSDDTWLIQESVLGELQGKPLLILKEQSASFKPGILADKEFIPFTLPCISASLVPVLEGLRDLGYHFC